jgi:hypothetical protein
MNPSGLCLCGCGQKTAIPKYSDASHGYVRGQPRDYVRYHQRRSYLGLDEILSLLDKTDPSGCWLWTRSHRGGGGYAYVRQAGKRTSVHRLVYEGLVGPIPKGKALHHLCEVKHCANPDHLRPVTRSEHSLVHGQSWPLWQLEKTHCPQGHPYDEANTYRNRGGRYCRTCHNLRGNNARKRRNDAARAAREAPPSVRDVRACAVDGSTA